MPVNSANQGIPEQQGTDLANLPSAQVSWDGVIENRLVQRFTNTADRTSRNPSPNENELSALASEDRYEVFDSANWVSLAGPRAWFTYARMAVDQSLSQSNTTPQNITALVSTLPTAGTFGFDGVVFYDCSTAADFQFDITWPNLATARFGGDGLMNNVTTNNGDARYASSATSGSGFSYGGAGVGTVVYLNFFGDITMGGTGGALQVQGAQSSSDATAITVRARSFMRVWRIS